MAGPKPGTDVSWAEDPASEVLEPIGLRDQGYPEDFAPAHQHVNWYKREYGRWIAWLEGCVDDFDPRITSAEASILDFGDRITVNEAIISNHEVSLSVALTPSSAGNGLLRGQTRMVEPSGRLFDSTGIPVPSHDWSSFVTDGEFFYSWSSSLNRMAKHRLLDDLSGMSEEWVTDFPGTAWGDIRYDQMCINGDVLIVPNGSTLGDMYLSVSCSDGSFLSSGLGVIGSVDASDPVSKVACDGRFLYRIQQIRASIPEEIQIVAQPLDGSPIPTPLIYDEDDFGAAGDDYQITSFKVEAGYGFFLLERRNAGDRPENAYLATFALNGSETALVAGSVVLTGLSMTASPILESAFGLWVSGMNIFLYSTDNSQGLELYKVDQDGVVVGGAPLWTHPDGIGWEDVTAYGNMVLSDVFDDGLYIVDERGISLKTKKVAVSDGVVAGYHTDGLYRYRTTGPFLLARRIGESGGIYQKTRSLNDMKLGFRNHKMIPAYR